MKITSKCNWLMAASRFFLVVILFLSSASILQAQVSGGSISGTVKDSSESAVPEAHVTIRNSETLIARTIEVNEQGFYRVPNLQPGLYEITITANGFETVERKNIILSVGAELVIDQQLKVGAVATKVEVSGDVSSVELSASSITDVINATTIRELPLNGRDWTQLATLEPGVNTVEQPGLGIGNDRGNRGLGTQMTIGGNRPQQNNYRLDGISINDYSNGAPGSTIGIVLGVDAIQEFSVVTNSAPASYGRTSGGVINAITRSGTNDFHGSAYEFLRNSALDARNFFDGPQVPTFRRNQFGSSAGGPIRKNHTFIFGAYEGLRQALGITKGSNVPSEAARNGQLSTGNVVVDPSVLPYLPLFPLPNGTVSGDTGRFNFAALQVARQDFFTVRLDQTFSQHDSLFGTYVFDDGQTSAPDNLKNKVLGTKSRRQAAIVEETHSFSPSVVNTVRFGFSRVLSDAPKTLSAINPLAADTKLGFIPGHAVGLINVPGLTNFAGGLGAVGEYDFHFNSFQAYDDAFLTKGAHSIQFGLALERIQNNELGKANPNGQYFFGSLSNFLTNQPISFNAPFGGPITPRGIRQTIIGTYAQDAWRIRPNLTLNLGLRYEMATVPGEVHGKLANLLSVTDATPRLGSPYFSNPTTLNFEPRVGFAWDPFGGGRTSVRGAFGMYDSLPLPYLFELTTILSAPFFEQGSVSGLQAGSFPTGAFGNLNLSTVRYAYIESHPHRNYEMQWNLSIQRDVARDLSVLIGYVGSRGVHQPFRMADFNFVQPTLTAQGYLWPCPSGFTNGICNNPGTGSLPNQNAGRIDGLLWEGSSIYHAMQLQVTKRMRHGLQFGGSYTWSKGIDNGSGSVAGDTFANSAILLPFAPRLSRGLSDFDIRHNLILNYIWQIPSPRNLPSILRWTTSGWQWGGIYRASAGLPFTPTIGGDPLGLNSQETFAFPDRLTGPGCGSLVNPGNPNNYIKTQCFAFPNPSTRLGNSGRNILVGPGLSNLDMSLFKNNQIEKISPWFNIQFRVEIFNILNHANFTAPIDNATLFNAAGGSISTAGLVDSTITTSRQVQFGLKVTW